MKKISLILLFFAVAIASCDKDENPGDGGQTNGDAPGRDTLTQKVFVEHFVGHRAVNVPASDSVVQYWDNSYGSQVVVASIHASLFAQPGGGFPNDLTTSAGQDIHDFFSPIAVPTLMVNRLGYPMNYWLYSDAMETAIQSALDSVPKALLSLQANKMGNSVDADITVSYYTSLNGTYGIAVWLTEDQVVSTQLTPAGQDSNYVHENVLRDSFNGAWGDTLSTGAVNLLTPYTESFTLGWDSTWNEQNCHVVAFLYDMATFEVLQVEEISL